MGPDHVACVGGKVLGNRHEACIAKEVAYSAQGIWAVVVQTMTGPYYESIGTTERRKPLDEPSDLGRPKVTEDSGRHDKVSGSGGFVRGENGSIRCQVRKAADEAGPLDGSGTAVDKFSVDLDEQRRDV